MVSYVLFFHLPHVYGDLKHFWAFGCTNSECTFKMWILNLLTTTQMNSRYRIHAKHTTDDYVTRGVSLGGSSSAIVTAILLQTDPRAAALSSLSMSLFGIITLALTSVPVIVKAVGSLVGS